MISKTRGIVFRYVKYRETSIIATIYTEEYGLQSYIINGIRSAKSKKSIASFAPLSLLDLVTYQKKNADVQRISDWKRSVILSDLFLDLRKSTMAMFLSEVLFKTVKESDPFPEMFEFIYHSVEWLEHAEEGLSDFHLQFLAKLSRYLGFGLDHYTSDSSMELLQKLSLESYGYRFNLNREIRKENLERILLFYKEHIDGFSQVKSLEVLKEVFDD